MNDSHEQYRSYCDILIKSAFWVLALRKSHVLWAQLVPSSPEIAATELDYLMWVAQFRPLI